MTEAVTSSVSNVEVISIPGTLTVDLLKGINMQSLYDGIINQFSTSTYTILGIDIPIIGSDCLKYQTIDPNFDIKETISRLFEYLSKLILKPIWEILEKLAEVLGAAIGDLLEIPVLGLKIPDLFKDDLPAVIENTVKKLWETSKGELIDLLKTLGIPWPFYEKTEDPELSIRKIAKDIAASLWQYLWKAVGKIIKIIKTAMLAFDISKYGFPTWSKIWDEFVDAILGSILNFLTAPLTLEELLNAVIDLAKEVFKLPVVTIEQLLKVIENLKLPVFGFPLDWKLPLNLKVENPEKDFGKILTDILMWVNNFFVGILKKFIEAIASILEFFGISISFLTKIDVPITICAIKNT